MPIHNVTFAQQRLFEQYPSLKTIEEDFLKAYEAMKTCYETGGKLLVCGNGGSAADAEHIVGELMKGFLLRRKLPPDIVKAFEVQEDGNYLASHLQGALPAIALTAHTALNTAFANDVAPDMVFAQQVYGYGRRGDVLIAMSTSGNSANVCNAAKTAAALGLTTIGITGRGAGALARFSDICLRLPAAETYLVQELTLPVYHAFCAMLEENFFS